MPEPPPKLFTTQFSTLLEMKLQERLRRLGPPIAKPIAKHRRVFMDANALLAAAAFVGIGCLIALIIRLYYGIS